MLILLLTCLAGGLGAVARSLVDTALRARSEALFATLPWVATLAINVTGSFVLGVATGTLTGAPLGILGTGFCGGFTTFSTASWQVARLVGRRSRRIAAAYLVLTVVGCLAAAWLGLTLAG
ncbi:fluoride efflux transporter FluC [Tessaracoccus lacteus]|uniref:Fluoride-specific ion channel FluC n=1 Tax=Tessaracoccus lacteus TaxID=3041766 RepID=A0ABY8PZI8_9ACTN|nr:CrcB family protein [Tessaracoccus sp. T21]WGT47656.1 CrcB family protein [Tessaracoccus sp. T21]